MDRDSGVSGGMNQLLAALPAAENHRLMHSLTPVFLDIDTVLFESGETVESVHFPRNCVVSLASPLQEGAMVQVATVGNEGVVGVPLAVGGSLALRATCSVAGWADRMDASTFLSEVERGGRLRELLSDYLQSLFGQISQAAACNLLHSTQARFSRWLLMSHDRVGSDEFAISNAFLGRMLGSSRSSVTLATRNLQSAGLINYHRGQLTIIDRVSLEAAACNCYLPTTRSAD
jgi:hypothetical protein